MSPETRNLDSPIRFTPRRLAIGAASCVGAGILVAVLGFSGAALTATPPPEPQRAAPSVTDTELPTYSIPMERGFKPRLPG